MGKNIIIGVCGSIAAYKAAEVVSQLKKKGFDISVVMTDEATKFVTPLTFQNLSGNQVITDMFELPKNWLPVHTSLADCADLVLVVPATANIMAKVAGGLCDDILSCVILATKAKVMFCPAMNTNMYKHKAVQENIRKLKNMGYYFIGPIEGHLACGYSGMGHIAETGDILKEATKLLK